ncbi:MAG TPA: VC0807 family protein [Pseudonocardiaceae bacterium]|nr:VC0807 family protein [Pseudonocardiaceae bacterium]
MTQNETNSSPTTPKPTFSRPNLRTFLPNLLVNWLAPVAVYELLGPRLNNDLLTLTISASIPALITIGTFVIRRRVNVLGLIAVTGFAIGLAVSVFTGGNELAIKLHEPVLTGAIGLILLVSVAIGRPLFLFVYRLLDRSGTPAPMSKRRAAVLSAWVGVTLLVHGIVITILALTLPTSTFMPLYRPIGLPILLIGIGTLFWYVRRSASLSRQGK